eukprot:g28797.t1
MIQEVQRMASVVALRNYFKSYHLVRGLAVLAVAGGTALRLLRNSSLDRDKTAGLPFLPKEGLQSVVVQPAAAGPVPLLLPHADPNISCVFDPESPAQLAKGEERREAWLYGAVVAGNSVCRPTGKSEDIIKGMLLCWPPHIAQSAIKEHEEACRLVQGGVRRCEVSVVQKDGTTHRAFAYFQQSEGVPESDSAKATALMENAQHLAGLKRAGVLGIERPIKITARAFIAGAPLPTGDKVVHLIRHGQGFHNLLADIYREQGKTFDATGDKHAENPYKRAEVYDSPLTAIGRAQAKALRPLAHRLAPHIDLLVTSPLTRAVQTALIAFGSELKARDVPFMGHPAVSETNGLNTCDKRRPLSDLKEDFANIDWSLITEEEDSRWSPDQRESPRSVSDRGYEFLLWLRSRPEQQVVIATHSAWLFTLLNTVVDCSAEHKTWFFTGELRSMVLSFHHRPFRICDCYW